MRGSSSLVLIIFSATAAMAISNDNIQRDIKTPIIRTPQYHQQHIIQLPRHLLRTNNNRQLRSDDISTIEFCGKCTWQGNISCEARAQYLVRNSSQSSTLTLQDARISILETCKSDGSDLSSIPIDAFCGTCQYMKMNFNCNSRVDYLVTTYYLGREKAIESLLKDGYCIDVNWVPPQSIEDDDNTNDSSLSNGAIVGIVIGITILLCCCIGLGALYYYTKQRLVNEQATAQQASQVGGSKRAKASEIRKKVMAEANARNNTDSPDSSSREEQDVKKKKSLSFSPPVVWNITSDGDKPDPPTEDEVINKEKKEIGNTQQVLDMMESALDTPKTQTKENEDPPDFRDSTISELSCNIDPPTDDEDEGVVLPSATDEEQALPNENQDALAIDNETMQNEETEGIVRRISLEP